ncbi:MAG: alpha/beta hydrolase [Thermodesulfobacteriota bacterium]|nr:alpha/beta hydrolase [Thermodesulfobacteriota bacterium]
MKIKEIDGVEIAVRLSKRGMVEGRKTLFFIHGSGGDHSVWEGQWSAMEDEFNIVAVDLPGHGQTGGGGEHAVARYSGWVKKTIEELGLRRPVLIGHSLGAAIVLELAIRYGDMLSGIVTLGGGAKMPVNPLVLDGMRSDPSMIINFIPEFAVAKKHRARLGTLLIDILSRADKDVSYGDFIACDALDITGETGRIRIPTLLICGADDKMMPPRFSKYLEGQIPGARLVLIKETGHFAMMEDAKAVNTALREFVNALEE